MTEERALLALRVSDVSRHGELGRSGRPLSGGEGGQANVLGVSVHRQHADCARMEVCLVLLRQTPRQKMKQATTLGSEVVDR
jgi:hypothetical protein